MRLPSLEELAERWTLGHTVAVAAWVVVVVLGLTLLLRGEGSTYPEASQLKVYAGENATFTYPANWTINTTCIPNKPFIELPGTIKTNYAESETQLTIHGTAAFNCVKGRPERFDIFPEDISADGTPCAPATSTRGERLSNGLYLQLQEEDDYVLAIAIRQNRCYAPTDTLVLGFGFTDVDPESIDIAEHGMPRVEKSVLLESPQYKDIRALAESIKY